jgi:hypothetical protein
MQRCLAKAIALHGIGLYIYNGEDLPPDTAETRQNAPQGDDDVPDGSTYVRDVADRCIALHAAAVVKAEKDADLSGFWELYEAAKGVQGEDRMELWRLLKNHSAVRSSLKEYADIDRKMAAQKEAA